MQIPEFIFLSLIVFLFLLYRAYYWYMATRRMEAKYWRSELGASSIPHGYIYAFFDPADPYRVKWGKSINWQRRMKQHQTANAEKLQVICIVGVRDMTWAEKYVHRMWSESKVNLNGGTEWFKASRAMNDFVNRITDPIEEW